jgi:hypothetical protein
VEIWDHAWKEEEESRKGDSIVDVDHGSSLKVIDWRTWSIAGPWHAQTLILLERAIISTMVLTKGYVAAGGELQGEKRVGLKQLLPAPTIVRLYKNTTWGHMKRGIIAEGVSVWTLVFWKRAWIARVWQNLDTEGKGACV